MKKTPTLEVAIGFIPVAADVDRNDADVLEEILRIARIGVEMTLGGTVVGDVDLTWNAAAGGYDARCMVRRDPSEVPS